MTEEWELVQSVLRGDLNAFGRLVSRYEKLVFSVLSRMAGNKADVEDLSQEVFIRVYKGLGKFEFQSKLSTWIARICYHRALSFLDKKGEKIHSYPVDIDEVQSPGEGPEAILIKKESNEYLNRLIKQLPLQYRTVLTLYHLKEFSYGEIQEITGYPEGTVKGYLFRARKMLKEKMEQVK